MTIKDILDSMPEERRNELYEIVGMMVARQETLGDELANSTTDWFSDFRISKFLSLCPTYYEYLACQAIFDEVRKDLRKGKGESKCLEVSE